MQEFQGAKEVAEDVLQISAQEDITAESDVEEVLLEPRFKYSRILNSVPAILGKDAASCMAIHDKFAALGSRSGYIYIVDHFGNLHPESTARHHRCAVAKISVEPTGSYFVSCAQDARISIGGITSSELAQVVDLKLAARSVAIAPDFVKRGSGHTFVIGERNLSLHQRTFFGSYKERILYEGMDRDGIITQISWQDCYIAFTNDTGTRIFDKNLDRMIALIQPVHGMQSAVSVKVCPSHCWINKETFAIGWYDTVSVCAIITSSAPQEVSSTEVKRVEVHFAWKLDMYIADISYTLSDEIGSWKEIAVFGMKKMACQKATQNECEMVLALLEPENSDTFSLTTEDRIEMYASDCSNLSSFHMSSLPYETLYFLLGSQQFIEAQPCSADDRVRWYLENDLLREAMQYANEHEAQLENLDAIDIGKRYLGSLIQQKRFAEAAANLRAVCGRQKDLWEYYVNEFEQNNVVLQLAKYLPINDPQLEPECYQCVLMAALHNHPVLFYNLIKVWSPDLFRVGAITDMAMKRVVQGDSTNPLSERDAVAIYRSLARLHLYERKYDKALMLYITLNDKGVFQVIEKYHLFDLVKNDLTKLMSLDTNLTIRLLIENAGSLPAKTVLTQISKYPKLQLAYLNSLFERNEGDEFVDLTIRLYAENEPQLLLPFLRKTAVYDISKAMDICEKKQYINEMVYLLGRSGNRMKALDLLVHKLNRLDSAIDFCRENDDYDLWNALIDAAVKRPDHVTQLLNAVGKYVDPLSIIRKIPDQMNIPGLRNSLIKILRDYELLVRMQHGCLQVTQVDSGRLFGKHMSNCKRAVVIDVDKGCGVCRAAVLKLEHVNDHGHANHDIIVYGCGHSVHARCLYSPHSDGRMLPGNGSCPLCSGLCLFGKR